VLSHREKPAVCLFYIQGDTSLVILTVGLRIVIAHKWRLWREKENIMGILAIFGVVLIVLIVVAIL